jgi:hypothetical protein
VSGTDPRVNAVRILLRNLQLFRSLHESGGVDEITAHNGTSWSLWDIEYLYEQAMRRPTGNRSYDRLHPTLPLRQQQAIQLFLVMGFPEDRAAQIMGLSPTNPVGMYATSGITRLLQLMDGGQIRRFRDDGRMFDFDAIPQMMIA